MGSAKRIRPERMGTKLLMIRRALGSSLAEMARRLSTDEFEVGRTIISAYEQDEREAPLPILLRYAEVANVYLEVIVDDRLDLPEELPSAKKSEGIKREA